jgi:hypothetical protein
MLDAAEFLTVVGPTGEFVDLRIDPIERDRAVYDAVNLRASGDPPTHTVEPGKTAHLRVPLFNRGWARYPLLAAGRYAVTFDYQPEWADTSWTEAGFGHVRAAPVTIEICEPAPELLREADRPMQLRVSPRSDELVAELVNTWDRPVWVNLNIGSELSVQSRLEWKIDLGDHYDAEPIVIEPAVTQPIARADRIRRIEPAESLAAGRVALSDLHERVRSGLITSAGPFEVRARYVHVAQLDALREHIQAREPGAQVPTHIFTGAIASEPWKWEVRSEK